MKVFIFYNYYIFFVKNEVNMDGKKKEKLDKKYEKYKIHENLIIAKQARKTIRYIEKNAINFPTQYKVLRDRIIDSCYSMLELIYRTNIFQDIKDKKDKKDKKEIVIKIQMLNFYLEEALHKELIKNKKFESYVNHLIDIDKMVRSWFSYETSKQSL